MSGGVTRLTICGNLLPAKDLTLLHLETKV